MNRSLPIRLFEGPGGLRVLVREDPSTPIAAACACFLGGSRLESRHNQGLTFLTQRLLVRGTREYAGPALAQALEDQGAHFSPFASKDLYGASLSVLSRNFPPALRLLAHSLLDSTFPEDRVERERSNQLLELDRRQEDPLRLGLEASEQLLYRGHPYGFSLLGSSGSLRRLGREQVMPWHQRLLSPPHGVLAVVGDLRAPEVMAWVHEAFEGLRSWTTRRSRPRACVPPPEGHSKVLQGPGQEASVVVAYQVPGFTSQDFPALQVVHHLLAGLGARLHCELRDRRGLAYVVDAALERRLDPGIFRIFLGTSPDQTDLATRSVLEQVEKLRQEAVGTRELRRAQGYACGLQSIGQQRKSSVALQLAFHELVGHGYRQWRNTNQALNSVTPDQVLAVARKYLDPCQATCVQVRPGRKKV